MTDNPQSPSLPNCSHKAQTVEAITPDEHGTYSVRVRCDLCKRAETYLKCTPTGHQVNMHAPPGITVVECETAEPDE